MPKLRDYACACGTRFEFLQMADEPVHCPTCDDTQYDEDIVVGCSKPFSTIIPMHRTSLKQKAGYVHTHADRPAERGSVAVPSTGGGL